LHSDDTFEDRDQTQSSITTTTKSTPNEDQDQDQKSDSDAEDESWAPTQKGKKKANGFEARRCEAVQPTTAKSKLLRRCFQTRGKYEKECDTPS